MTQALDPATRAALKAAKLKLSDDAKPGVTRKKVGKTFAYFDARGKKITKLAEIERLNKLAVPPAYQDVWISPDPRGHIQATGRDARGRKQYRYHADWRRVRDDDKYCHVIDFAKALPKIRRQTAADLRRKGLPREKVVAAVVRVMEKTLIRVGNDEYARTNESYGLTTLQDEHATITGKKVVFTFKGKSGVQHEIDLSDARLAKIVQQCRDLPGEELFQYEDDKGKVHDIVSADVNAYLRRVTGQDFTAKDFRTWAGTVLAAKALRAFEATDKKTQVKKNLLTAIETVAQRLGNTKAVCRKSYIHPSVLTAYLDGDLAERLKSRAKEELKIAAKYGLDADEESVLRMLERKL